MSRWQHGCGAKFTTWIPRGFGSREVTVECGSTSHTGDVYQCDRCETKGLALPGPYPEESDLDYDERIHAGDS